MTSVTIKSFNGIGDALFMTPTLRCIKEKYPDLKIIVNTNYRQLFEFNPFVDEIGNKNEGLFLGYPDPIHCKEPIQHHIISDWEIIKKEIKLPLDLPDLKPEIYRVRTRDKNNKIGVQVTHKGHWDNKKVWPFFEDLIENQSPFFDLEPIPHCNDIATLIDIISDYKAVVCAEGGISHIAKAVDTHAIVLYGGFADPKWNGYESQTNLAFTETDCSYCYNSYKCIHSEQRYCMKQITVDMVAERLKG